MFAFFSTLIAIAWFFASFLILFKVWDSIGPAILGISKSHIWQVSAMIITFLVIYGVPAWIWAKLFF